MCVLLSTPSSLFFFFFSSRRRHTRFDCDWSQTCALPIYLAVEADLLRLGKRARDLVGGHAGLDQRDRLVHPLARLLVGGDLRLRRAPHAEGAVVARAIADERHDDVEERLVAGPDDPIGEV